MYRRRKLTGRSETTGRDGMLLPIRSAKISQGEVERSKRMKSRKALSPGGPPVEESRRAGRGSGNVGGEATDARVRPAVSICESTSLGRSGKVREGDNVLRQEVRYCYRRSGVVEKYASAPGQVGEDSGPRALCSCYGDGQANRWG